MPGPDENAPAEDGCGEGCNPFMTCNSCVGCTISDNAWQLVVREKPGLLFVHFQECGELTFSKSVWNPPRFVG